jgi:hypothetical protein
MEPEGSSPCNDQKGFLNTGLLFAQIRYETSQEEQDVLNAWPSLETEKVIIGKSQQTQSAVASAPHHNNYVGVLISLWLFLFSAQPKEFFLDGLKKLQQRSHKCVELRGEYVE